MRIIAKSVALGLTALSVLLAVVWMSSGRVARSYSAITASLMRDLRAEMPFYCRWLDARLVPGSPYRIPKWLASRVLHAESSAYARREQAVAALGALGANAWPAVPELVEMLEDPNLYAGVAAGRVLVRLRATEHPDWPRLETRLTGRRRSAQVFRSLLIGRDGFPSRFDQAHRQFALVGLAAIGPAASNTIPDVFAVLKSKEHHQLWPSALATLGKTGGNLKNVVPFQTAVLLDEEEWPDVRVSAMKALVAGVSDCPEAPGLLRRCLLDEKSLVRLTAARELWKLDARADEVLPTLTALLGHNLISIRTGALNAISEVGRAARPIRSEVARLISDTNESVRQAAVATLTRIAGQSNAAPDSANQPVQPTGVSRSAEEPTGTPSAAGSRR